MSSEIVQKKLAAYQCQTILEQENALKEIAQEIALMALSRAGFFKLAAFQGGTCLRILYGLPRFSEDLDFILEKPDKNFNWKEYISNMQEEFFAYGYTLEVANKTKLDKAVKTAFLKANSTGGILEIKDITNHQSKLKIKLEIDTNPPEGSAYELKYLDFPLPYSIKTQDLSTLFAGKSHALLCREYPKGRDWFDFLWYVTRGELINFSFLSAAIWQSGPWKGQHIAVTPQWFIHELNNKINHTDWKDAKKDVENFLKPRELASLEVWCKEFFISRADKLADYLIS